MQTQSHLLMTAVLNQVTKKQGHRLPPLKTGAFLLGSVMPDVPLIVLSLLFFIFQPSPTGQFIDYGARYDAMYFTNPVWIVGHNLFHAPFNVAVMVAVGWHFGVRKKHNWALMLFWFGLACGLHSAVDILTHVDDGPLVFFPFNWAYRFRAPVSYWDDRYGARWFSMFEMAFDLAAIGFLIFSGVKNRRHKRQVAAAAEEARQA